MEYNEAIKNGQMGGVKVYPRRIDTTVLMV